ncbi:MAG: hypothetical protein CM15mP102_08450 [Flavobacteriales bacterium]|nr:MAG: hypothetical protein CM15mP102_08450 [Flavobacteriales bacterium]
MLLLPLALPIASISSINIIEGDLSFACLNRSLTLDAPTPQTFQQNQIQIMRRRNLASPATAFAKVFYLYLEHQLTMPLLGFST